MKGRQTDTYFFSPRTDFRFFGKGYAGILYAAKPGKAIGSRHFWCDTSPLVIL